MKTSCPRVAAVFLFTMALHTCTVAAVPDLTVPLPQGVTPLTELGLYTVGYQSYGKDPVWMPVSWTGHFDSASGISYADWGRVLGRHALLMHSPWHVPPGKTWVDYQLALPRVTPIQLAFGIAMGPDVAVPGRSDGVTFSCYLTANGQTRELMRQHQDTARWRDYTFDLSPYAGQTPQLRLQVEPGPRNNASWDYSFFGDARLIVGRANPPRSDLLQPLLSSRAYRVTAAADRARLSNSPLHGVAPSNLLPCQTALQQSGDSWVFTYSGEDCRVVYTYTPATGTLDDWSARVDDGAPFLPAHGGGASVLLPAADPAQKQAASRELALADGKPVDVHREGDTLVAAWQYKAADRQVRIDWTFRMVGKALVISARCQDPIVSRFSLGEALAARRQSLRVPYLAGTVFYLPVQMAFTCRYLDWTRSQSSHCPQGTAIYEPKTDGTRNPLFETGYIAVSPEVDEVLPNIPHSPSPFLQVLAPLVMLDIWGHARRGYAGDAAWLRELKDNGVDHLAIIQHDWQRYGYDVKLPDHLPANPAYGGDEGMITFGRAANECGYRWSLHENYIDLYPDAPSYDPAARVLQADGSPSKAWYNPGTRVQSFGLKCNRALAYAQQNSPEAHRRYGTTAAYLDVHTCVPPWHQLDHEAGQPMAAMAQAKVRFDTALFQFERTTHAGPLFGEGANHFYWAGCCDGVEAQVEGGEHHRPFLDFDLLKIHPQMVNHGLGYYERWFERGYDAQYGVDAGSTEQWDKYRAMELAYGHAGFVGNILVHNLQAVVREHHLMHPVQRLYGNARPLEIRYEVDGQLVTASAALVVGDTTRQRIRYDSGLTLWVNWRAQPWTVVPAREGLSPRAPGVTPPSSSADLPSSSPQYILPRWGFLALGPGTEVATVLRDGRVADYARCPEFLFLDARTWFDLPYLRPKKDIEPRLRDFKYLGGDRVQVTYEWVVNDTLDADYNCFVHAANAAVAGSDHIVFQGDHALPKPTSLWRPGEVIVDGPHELHVSPQHDEYDLTIGLFARERLRLKGADDGTRRILIARLQVERQDGRITGISARKITPATRPAPAVAEADFAAHTNPPGTWIDFGLAATDGAIKVDREKDRLVVFPYPRDRVFRASLALKALAPSADPARVRVRALAAGTQADLGPVEARIDNGRLLLPLGKTGAGRYLVTWQQ